MKLFRIISITIATVVCMAAAAQAALAGGEPKNERPFTRPIADRTLAQATHPSRAAAQAADPRGEPKNELPFTRPVTDRTLAQATHPSRSAQAADPRGEPKNELPFTRPVLAPAASDLYDVGGTLVDPSMGGAQRGEAKGETPFTRPVVAPTIVVRAGRRFDWGDAGIGAAAMLGLVIVALGGAALRAPHGRRPRATSA